MIKSLPGHFTTPCTTIFELESVGVRYNARDNYFFFRFLILSRRTIILYTHYRVSLFRLLYTRARTRMKKLHTTVYYIPWALFRSYCPNRVRYLNKQDPRISFQQEKKSRSPPPPLSCVVTISIFLPRVYYNNNGCICIYAYILQCVCARVRAHVLSLTV